MVLIFVLVAFALLLAALVTGSAAWAWVSVMISVAAAGALFYDWVQRRAAAKGGGRATQFGSASTEMIDPPTTTIPAVGSTADPATEVFSAVRVPDRELEVAGVDRDQSAGRPLVATPSSSAEQPPGAQQDEVQPTDTRSQNVTDRGFGRSADEHDSAASERTDDEPDQRVEDRVEDAASVVDTAPESAPESAGDKGEPTGKQKSIPRRPVEAGRPDARVRDRTSGEQPPVNLKPDEPDGVVSNLGNGRPVGSSSDSPSADVEEAAGGVAEAAGETEDKDKKDKKSGEPAQLAAEGASDSEPARAGNIAQPPPDSAEVTQTITAVRGTAEPPEERAEPAASGIVANLTDEVLVVDEQPRYHLAGCPILAGRETIPLPVKEAVEYEFTPCAVCTPVRVLTGRNRAASSS
ncbi:MAG: hypothetical protein JO100_03195 [Pseudonocardia sp.]|nr:hypothetical protein [Pseudonocardia sp.]